ncbi:MAG: C25 family cysteine peptidase, partial [Thermoplasmata archaeon]
MRFRKMRVLFAIVITSLFVSSLLSSVETKNREDAELTSSPSVDNESHKRRAGNDVGTDINNREGLLSSEDQFRVRIIESDVYGITLQFSVGNLKTYTKKASGQIYATFDSPGYGTTSEVGKPQIPVVRKMIAIPRGSEVRLSVLDAQYSSFGNGKVYPSQNPPIEGNPSDVFVIDSDFYSRDAFYPANAVEIESLGFLRDLRVALLQVNPIRFNPAKDVFEISHNIRVRLEYTVPYERSLEGTRDRRISPAFEDLYESAILNYDSIEGYLETEDRANYLIITNDSFYPSVLPLADWKRQKGLEVKVENLSNIGNSDTAIYNYIYDAYHNWELPPSYVLLVGDVEYLPTHYGLYHYYEDNYTATDLYYATVDGGDYLPDIHVGRISVKTSLEANDIISKVIGYEKDPYLAEREWYHQAVVISDYEAGRPFEDTSNYVHNFLTSQGYDVSKVYHSMGGDISDISKNVNSGRLIVNYRGHGQRDEWYRPTFTNSDVVGLSNGRKLPIVIGPTCRSAWFDWPLGDSFGETWVKVANRGSVGYFGSSRVSYSYYNDELDKGVFWAIFDDGMRRFGQITDKAKLYMLEKFGYYGEYTHLQFEMYNVLGDPELSVWIGLPPEAEDVGTESIDSLMNKGRYLKGPHEIKATIKNYGVTLQDDFNVSAEVREIATQTVLAFTDNMENYTNPSRGGWSLLEWHRDVGNWESGAPASVGPSSAHSGS